MYKRQTWNRWLDLKRRDKFRGELPSYDDDDERSGDQFDSCLLYTSDAADERSSVDLGGRRIIKKKSRKCLQ